MGARPYGFYIRTQPSEKITLWPGTVFKDLEESNKRGYSEIDQEQTFLKMAENVQITTQ